MTLFGFEIPHSYQFLFTNPELKATLDKLELFLHNELKQGKIIYPKAPDILSGLRLTPFNRAKVIILGQDPYHGQDQANGLAFSVKPGIPIPPSLRNIFKEIRADLGMKVPEHGDLSHWASQGVLLLNTTLTVESGQPGSHFGKGWEAITDLIIKSLSDQQQNLVFMLWGAKSIKKQALVDENKHLVLTSAHPSPLSAYRGFFGSKQFSKCNNYLKNHHQSAVKWGAK